MIEAIKSENWTLAAQLEKDIYEDGIKNAPKVGKMTTYEQMQKRVAELQAHEKAEQERLKLDAERYRWLRNTQNMDCRDSGENMDKIGTIESIMVVESMGGSSAPWPDELDAAVDAAMKANP